MDIHKVLPIIRPEAKWVARGDDYDGLEWVDETQTKPSEDEISQEIERLWVEHERTQYQRQRKPEYPSITDQLDALFHAGVFPPEMAEQIQAIKDKYPKPE
jgi:hypothetical protein